MRYVGLYNPYSALALTTESLYYMCDAGIATECTSARTRQAGGRVIVVSFTPSTQRFRAHPVGC